MEQSSNSTDPCLVYWNQQKWFDLIWFLKKHSDSSFVERHELSYDRILAIVGMIKMEYCSLGEETIEKWKETISNQKALVLFFDNAL